MSRLCFSIPSVALLLLLSAGAGMAKDLGTHGPLFEVTEPSILDTIRVRLSEMETNGEIAQMQRDMQDRTRAYVDRPRPVAGLARAEKTALWEVDLSITLTEDLADHQGQVFAGAGTVVNPLAYSRFDKRIVLFDGDDPDQVGFALETGGELDTLLVLVNGDPLGLMRAHGRRFYFDQDGVLVKRFGIRNVPAVVQRADPVMQVQEIALGKDGEGRP
jgi:conjugal transfer pilus assembly protein TraW